MDESRGKSIKAAAWMVLAVAAAVYAYTYHQEVANNYPARTFSVEGSAEVDTTPDVAVFSAAVVTEGDRDVAVLQKANSEKMNAINAYVKEQGIKSQDLKTLQYSLTPRYGSMNCAAGNYCPPATIVGYTLTQSLQIKVRDMGTMSALLSGVVEKGANNVSDVKFVLDDDDAAKNDAREQAIEQAKQKAKASAKAAGFRLGDLISLYEASDMVPQPYADGFGGETRVSAKILTAPAVEAGTQSTKVTVTLTYEVKH